MTQNAYDAGVDEQQAPDARELTSRGYTFGLIGLLSIPLFGYLGLFVVPLGVAGAGLAYSVKGISAAGREEHPVGPRERGAVIFNILLIVWVVYGTIVDFT